MIEAYITLADHITGHMTVYIMVAGDDIGMVLSPQCFHNLNLHEDIFNHSNIHFWEYMQPGYDALGFISCTGGTTQLGCSAQVAYCISSPCMHWRVKQRIKADYMLLLALYVLLSDMIISWKDQTDQSFWKMSSTLYLRLSILSQSCILQIHACHCR